MKVAAITGFEGQKCIEIQDREKPKAEAFDAVVKVGACSLNRHDLWILEGDSAMVSQDVLPFVTGLDLAGTVTSVGSEVSHLDIDDRVVMCPNQTCGSCQHCLDGFENECEEFDLFRGGFAEEVAVNADRLIPLPNTITTTAAATLPTAYVTAWHMLRRAETEPGDLVFVPGATGGVGVAAMQLINVFNGTSIGTSTSQRKIDRLNDLGADYTINSSDPATLKSEVEAIGKPDTVLNHLGGEYTQLGLDVLKRSGRMVICGRTTGGTAEIDITDLFLNYKRVLGSTMGTMADLQRLVGLVDKGAFKPVIGKTYTLEEAGQAFADMQNREVFGKQVIRP